MTAPVDGYCRRWARDWRLRDRSDLPGIGATLAEWEAYYRSCGCLACRDVARQIVKVAKPDAVVL